MSENQFDISVVICCYNSANRLKQTLLHLSNQILKLGVKCEIILIDNNSNDNTTQVAEEIWNEFNNDFKFQIISESKPGLSNARKKGIECSKGEFIVFCDDDNWLQKDYLQIGFDFMLNNAKIGMLGGIGTEFLDSETPSWFNDFKDIYAVGSQAENDGDVTFQKGYVYGAGVFFRKSTLSKLFSKGVSLQLSDRIGKKLVSGGDNELGYLIAISGFKIYYNSNLKFVHFITKNRLTFKYVLDIIKGHQFTYFAISEYQKLLLKKKYDFPKNRFVGLFKTIKKLIRLFMQYKSNRINTIEYKIKSTKLFYRQINLLIHYNLFLEQKEAIQKNIFFLSNFNK